MAIRILIVLLAINCCLFCVAYSCYACAPPPNIPPTAEISFSEITVEVGQTVYFAGIGSDTDGSVVGYVWTFPSNVSYYVHGNDTANAKCKFNTEGQYNVTFYVIDDDWAKSDTETCTVSVSGRSPVWYVATDGNNDNDGQSPESAFSSIQVGIDSAAEDETVIVEEGVYNESIGFHGEDRDITVKSTNPDDPAVVANTVIDGAGIASVVTFEGSETSDCELTGFTIRDGGLRDDVDISSPIAHWKFDETSGSTAADNAGSNNGTLNNMEDTDWVTGRGCGNALVFDGDNEYVEITGYKGITGTNARTCAAWIKKDSTAWGHIISWGGNTNNGDRWLLWVDSVGHLRLTVKGGYVYAKYTNLSDGNWHHVAATFEIGADGNLNEANVTDVKLYVDGKEDTTLNQAQEIHTEYTENVRIGLLTTTNAKYFDGIIDDVRIYNRALSAHEISELADIREPVGHWKLDESNPNDTAVDTSDNSNDGTLNMDDDQWTAGKFGNALNFVAADNDYISIIGYKGITSTNARTCAAWIKSSSASHMAIMSWGANSLGEKWTFRVTDAEHIRVEVNGGGIYGDTDVIDGNWHHVAVVWENDGSPYISDAKLYVDGQEENTTCSNDEPVDTASSADVKIGDCFVTGRFFNGSIDDVRLYDRALTKSEIGQLYRGGGGIGGNSTGATIDKCVITENSALEGGGIAAFDGKVSNCVVVDNSSDYAGGGLSDCAGTIENCIVYHNSAGESGGGLDSCGTIKNCTVAKNSATAGGGIKGCTTITNCIITDNGDDLDSCSATYSYVQDEDSGQGNRGPSDGDPSFIQLNDPDGPDGVFFTVDDGLRLKPDESSKCIDHGSDATGIPSSDIMGLGRVNVPYITDGDDGHYDMGAYEARDVYRVKKGASGATGKSWDNSDAFGELYTALANSDVQDGGEIWVAANTYKPETSSQDNKFQMYEGVEIYGGFDGTEMARHEREIANNVTILSGDIDTGGSNDSHVVVAGADNAILDGFTIKDAIGQGNSDKGAILCASTSPSIINCIIHSNHTGVYCSSSSPVITNCTIADNSAYGIYCDPASPVITNCIVWNEASGADDLYGCSATYSCIKDGDIGTGNISFPPYFVDAPNNDYSLQTWSKCIDAGDPESDYHREPSGGGSRISMGAYGNTEGAATKSADSDSDGLPDDWEDEELGGTSYGAGDNPDSDDFTNLIEYQFGYDPDVHSGNPDTAMVSVSISPAQFDPAAGEKLSIEYYLNKATNVDVRFVNTDSDTPVIDVDDLILLVGSAGYNSHQDIWDGTHNNVGTTIVERAFYHIRLLDDDNSDTPLWVSTDAEQTSPISVSTDSDDSSFDPFANIPVEITTEVSDWCRQTIDVVKSWDSESSIYHVSSNRLLEQGSTTFYWYGHLGVGSNTGKVSSCLFGVDFDTPVSINKGPVLVYYDEPLSDLRCNPYRIISTNNEVCKITYELKYGVDITIKIYDPDGDFITLLDSDAQTVGQKEVIWDGKDPDDPDGKYILKEGVYRIEVKCEDTGEKLDGSITVYK
jgi:parallel beta-helix repeat protein